MFLKRLRQVTLMAGLTGFVLTLMLVNPLVHKNPPLDEDAQHQTGSLIPNTV